MFFLEGVTDVAKEATETARQIVALRESHRRLITENFGRVAANGLKVLESLYSLPIVTVGKVAAITGVSFTAANQLVNKFVENELLTEFTGQARNRRFRYSQYIGLFAD